MVVWKLGLNHVVVGVVSDQEGCRTIVLGVMAEDTPPFENWFHQQVLLFHQQVCDRTHLPESVIEQMCANLGAPMENSHVCVPCGLLWLGCVKIF